jgi:hypothetical protein
MSGENYSGPQKVAIRAQEIEQCPFAGTDEAEAYWEQFTPVNVRTPGVTREDFDQQKLDVFALSKVVSDELAARLPAMRDKYPPYGLTDLYRASRSSELETIALTGLSPQFGFHPERYTPFQRMLDALNSAYGSKLINHFYTEVEDMHKDPRYSSTIEALGEYDQPGLMIHGGPVDDTCRRMLQPAQNARDTVLGFFHALPTVFEAQFDRVPEHEEAVDILRNSKRLAIAPSLLNMPQFQALLIGSTEKPGAPPPYGWNFRPDILVIRALKSRPDALVMDFVDGIGALPAPEYSLDSGEFGDSLIPSVRIDNSSERKLGEVAMDREALTCPSRKLISAMWDDMVDIADQTRIFDYVDKTDADLVS